MTRKYKHGSRPTVCAREMESEWKETESSWNRTLRIPVDQDTRKMFALAVSEDVKVVMISSFVKEKEALLAVS